MGYGWSAEVDQIARRMVAVPRAPADHDPTTRNSRQLDHALAMRSTRRERRSAQGSDLRVLCPRQDSNLRHTV